MRQVKQLVGLICLAFMIMAISAVCAAASRPDCRICGMWIDQNLNTRHVFTFNDGSEVMFCSFTCAAKYLKNHQAGIKWMQVADYLTTELVDTTQAVYLVDSDAPPVMSNTSIVAFANREEAAEFQFLHGGRLMTFDEVLVLE